MRLLGLAVLISVLSATTVSAAEPKAIDLMRRLCIETKAKPEAVRAAALAAGFPPSKASPGGYDIPGEKETFGLVMTGTAHMSDEPELGAVADDVCQLYVFPHGNQAPEVLAWLGAKPDAPRPWSWFFVEENGSARIIGGRDGPAKRAAMAAGTLRLIKVEPLEPEGMMIFYSRPRADDRAGSPGSAKAP